MMNRAKVLVADDELHLTHLLSSRLGREGILVLTADDGEQALEIALSERPDLVITDFQMPRLSGLELATRLRNNPSTADIPVLMLTARGHKLTEEDLANTGIRQVIPKPFSLRDLLPTVASILREGGFPALRLPA